MNEKTIVDFAKSVYDSLQCLLRLTLVVLLYKTPVL